MPDELATWDMSEATQLFKTVAKNIAIISTILYLFGWIALQLYLGSWGITAINTLAIRNVVLGALFAAYLTGPFAIIAATLITFRHSKRLELKVIASAAVALFGSLCLAAVWAEALASESFPVEVRRRSALLKAYQHGVDSSAAVNVAMTLMLMLALLYVPLWFLWRRLRTPLGAQYGVIIIVSIVVLAGLLSCLGMFSELVSHIPVAFGGGYYGEYVLALSPDAQKALHGDNLAVAHVPVTLLYIDGDAIYIANTGQFAIRGARETIAPTASARATSIETHMARVALREVIAMHRVTGDR
jgi:hypothetical protein